MRSKQTFIIFGGVLVTLILLSFVWYMTRSKPLMTSPGAQQMEGMDGMDMGGPSRAEEMDGMAQAAVMVAPARRQLIGVKIEEVRPQRLETVIRAVGTVDYDERRIRQVNLRVSGWITDLHADYTGKLIQQGDPLFTLYSPDLVSTQEEYLLAKETLDRVQASPVAHIRRGAASNVELARRRLLLWDLTDAQIARLDQGHPTEREVTIYSPLHGVVTRKMAQQGMYVTPEMNLYEIADHSVVWLYADLYEYELPLVEIGQEVTATLASYPGERFQGKVIYIYPYLKNATRTVQVRMEFPNPQGMLKPGMYGNVEIRVDLKTQLAIPQEALLDSGIRKVVFVDQGGGMYEPREVTVGQKTNQYYPVLTGLKPGERVVTSGTFLIDSESKLMAATNMMGALGMGGIRMEQAQMGEMEMGGMETAQAPPIKEQLVDGLTLTLTTRPDPPKKGENRLLLVIRSEGALVTDAKVTLGYTMAMPGMEVETVKAVQTTGGVYEAVVDFGMKGAWDVKATVARGTSQPVTVTFTVSVR